MTIALALSMGLSANCISGLNVVASDGDSTSPSANIDYIKGDDSKNFYLTLTLRDVKNCTCAGLKFTYNPEKVSIPKLDDKASNLAELVEMEDKSNASLVASSNGEFEGSEAGQEVKGVWKNFTAKHSNKGAGSTGTDEKEVELLYLVHPSAPKTVAAKYSISTTEGTENRLFSTTKDYEFLRIPFFPAGENNIPDDLSGIIKIESLQLDNDRTIKELVSNNGLTIDPNLKDANKVVTIHANGGTFNIDNFKDGKKGTLNDAADTLTVTCDKDGNITLPDRVDITRPSERMFLCWYAKPVNTNGPVNSNTVLLANRYYSGEKYDSSKGLNLYAVWALAGDINGDGAVTSKDRTMLLGQFGDEGNNKKADINGDGAVTSRDRTILLGKFGEEEQ